MPTRKFSERKGYTKPVTEIQVGSMTADLRNSIWNSLVEGLGFDLSFIGQVTPDQLKIIRFIRQLWSSYFKEPVDSIKRYDDAFKSFRNSFFACEWYEVYDLLEFILIYFNDPIVNEEVNATLERELSAYRFVGGVITDITSQQEIEMLETTFANQDFPAVNSHLKRALELLSDRKTPDYRNSIKESISAVESIAKQITNKQGATLSDCLKSLEGSHHLHPALKDGFDKLYGYTNDANGIRHAMLDEPTLTAADAKYFLLSCTSFINYLKSKI